MRIQSRIAGFTFIEVLTVTVLIAVLATIAVVSYRGVAEKTRDSRRKKDLHQLQLAVESYRQVNGTYPPLGTGCGTWAYPGCQSSGDWIEGVIPDFLEQLPLDPKQSGGDDLTQPDQFSFKYSRPTTTTYYLLVKLENENDPELNGAQYGFQTDVYVLTEVK